MRKLLGYLKPYRLQVILGPIFKLTEAVFELIVPLVLANMIDNGVRRGDLSQVYRGGGLLLLLAAEGLGCALVCQKMASIASQGYGTALRSALYRHINALSHAELDQFGTPSLITRITNDVNQLQFAVAMLIRLVVRAPFLALGAMLMALRIDWRLGLVFLVVTPLIALALYLLMSRSVPFFKVMQQKLDRISLITRENLTGARVVRAFTQEPREQARFSQAAQEQARVAVRVGKLSALLNPVTYLIMNFGIVAILWFGGAQVDAGALTRGQVMAFVNYMTQTLLALMVVANLVVTFTKAAASAARVSQVLEARPSIVQAAGPAPAPVPGAPCVRFAQVSFAFHAGRPVLRDLDFAVEQGQTVGIIGGTGAGKSALLNLIPRLYEVSQGRVLLHGVDVRDLPFAQLRGQVGMVPQKAQLFSGTVRSNLLWRDPNATDEQLWQALRTAQAADFVQRLPQGLDSPVEAGGQNFSGGQRQRLHIARALVGKPRILLLDDASSALDFATDAALRRALRQDTAGATVFLVSQRAAALRGADQILVLDDGRLVGAGTHAQLLAGCALYREICQSQSEGGKGAAV